MSASSLTVILGVLMIINGISMIATPIMYFLNVGYCIIALFFINAIIGIVRGIGEKRYDRDFFFSLLSLILGIVAATVPSIRNMDGNVLYYMAVGWFFLHGLFSVIASIKKRKEGAGIAITVINILFGAVELIVGIYSLINPASLAQYISVLAGFYYIESGFHAIFVGSSAFSDSNMVKTLFIIVGILTIIGGICMFTTPVADFLSVGACIAILFFTISILGIVRAVSEKRYDKDFFLSLLCLILGIVLSNLKVDGSILFYIAVAWFFLHGILSIITAINKRKQGAGIIATVIGVILGVAELFMGIYSVINPSALAAHMSAMIGLYYIESGLNTIYVGSGISGN